jgi:copper chaperone CopZ
MKPFIDLNVPVTGMSCNGCSARVEQTLKDQKGVLEASVDLTDAVAKIKIDPGITNLEN